MTLPLFDFSPASKDRRDTFLSAVRDFVRPMLRPVDGSWTIELTEESGRLDMQLATAFYCGDAADIALANKLTRRAPTSTFNGHRFNIFQTSIACHHLVVFRELLEPETVSFCEELIAEGCEPCPGMVAPDLQFQGYNDNMPAMATKTLILGGELLDRSDLFEMGRWKLRRFAEMLGRYGLISEYNSPNYTPDTIHNLMTIVTHARDAECRDLAARIVRRVWLDLAAHWHPGGQCPAGPFSRAYNHDFNNYVSSLNCLVWFLFGPEVGAISAHEAMRPRAGIQPMHGNDPLEHTARMAWYALTDASLLDDATAGLFRRKSLPFELIATALQGDSTESPTRKITATSFLTSAYSLGSASFSFHGGQQTSSLYATGCKEGVSPVLFSRYLIDETFPGQEAANDWHVLTTGEAEIGSRATAVTVQHQSTALASYVPHRDLGTEPTSRLRLAIIAPRSVGQFQGFIDSDGQPLIIDQAYPADQWFGAVLGSAIAAIQPMAYTALDLPPARVIPRRNSRYDYLEIVNYDGPARTFTRKELGLLLNGVTMELADSVDWGSTQAFLQALEGAAVWEDQYLFRGRRLRYHRAALADRPSLMLGLNYSAAFDGVAERLINGELAPEPVWQCPGFPADTLPLMGDDKVLAPPGLPWKDLTVHWFPDEPWKIHR